MNHIGVGNVPIKEVLRAHVIRPSLVFSTVLLEVIVKIVSFLCDPHAGVAPAHEYLLHRMWSPRCPYPLEFLTNKRKLRVAAPVHYYRGEDLSLGWRLGKYLDSYPDPLILVMAADYLVVEVNHDLVLRAESLCREPDVKHVRLRPRPAPTHSYPNPAFGRIGGNYMLSLQPGIWETQTLRGLLRDDEDPWRTEMQGSRRAKKLRGIFLTTEETAITYINWYNRNVGRSQEAEDWVREHVPAALWPSEIKLPSEIKSK